MNTRNYCYIITSFKLKNVGATYQHMMNKVFKYQIKKMLEVYMDDMILNSTYEFDHIGSFE